ncbi:protein-tyrosine-phosphatase [Lichenihabitans sp. Uapishka_5]|uniref:tyrosine phosphatase family protein n=1 Tax=Lichenihabitans sp. Uapishka_5 TaxID=3037302 RepID=UPI0029E7DEA5|nr:protein-tyrosine-phosphatase [Lichenihabitans sp. Uapishka_5]MDX7953810.1 protein-tyrosine-phosphatase [Lichenihabitans sp. Uapishka_5]
MPVEQSSAPSPPTLTICGLAEIAGHGGRAVTHALSLLDPGTPEPDGFAAYGPHHRVTLSFHDAITPAEGTTLPTRDDVAAILAFGRDIAAPAGGDAQHLLVHCHMGISRSTAAMAMLLAQAEPALDEDAVLARIATERPQAWPNSRMIGFADELLGRQGRFTAALGRLYARRLAEAPEIAAFMHANGRSQEISLAEAGARDAAPGAG